MAKALSSMQNDFTMHQFRLFLKVADTGSISRAAIALGLPQPSISRIIARVEANAGAALFERSSRGVLLTASGEMFREHARGALRHHELALSKIRDSSGILHGEARIATVESVANILFVPLFKRFQRLHPRAQVRVVTSSSVSIPSLINNDIVDIGIIADTHTPPALPLEPLCREDLYLIGPRDAPVIQRESITLTEVADLPLLLNAMTGGYRSLIDDAFAGIKRQSQVRVEIDSNELLLDLVLDGEGYAILPYSAIAGRSRIAQLAAVRIVAPVITRGLSLITTADRPFSATCREAAYQVRTTMQEYAGNARWHWNPNQQK